jgi:hypothetical protein
LNIAQELHNGHQCKSKPSGIDKKRGNGLERSIDHVLNAGYSIFRLEYLKKIRGWFYRAEASPTHKISKICDMENTEWQSLQMISRKDLPPRLSIWPDRQPQLLRLNYSCF